MTTYKSQPDARASLSISPEAEAPPEEEKWSPGFLVRRFLGRFRGKATKGAWPPGIILRK